MRPAQLPAYGRLLERQSRIADELAALALSPSATEADFKRATAALEAVNAEIAKLTAPKD